MKHIKKIILALILLVTNLSMAAGMIDQLNDREIDCATDMGGYDEVQKFTLGALLSDSSRNLEVHSQNEYYNSACMQFEEEIVCEWSKYTVKIDTLNVEIFGDSENTIYELRGVIDAPFRFDHTISCKSYPIRN